MNVGCHPERSARLTRFLCGSGGRGVEGPLWLRKIRVWPRGAAPSQGLPAAKGFLRLLAALVAQDDNQKTTCAHE
jgi:hypothetical protein